MRIKIKDGTSWPIPTGDAYDSMWRFRYALKGVTPVDALRVVEMAEAYAYLVSDATGCRTTDQAVRKLRTIRAAIRGYDEELKKEKHDDQA